MLLNRRVTFVGGKGGVGKTTVAACAALAAADAGRSVLLVSTDPAHSTGDILETGLGPSETAVAPGLDAIELDPEAEVESYIEDVKARLAEAVPPRLAAEVERQVDVARVSPGAEEAALFERFARVLDRSAGWDHLVFDTAPTAQTLRLLGLPELMSMWMSGLIQRRQKVNAWGRMWRNVAGAEAGSAAGPGRGGGGDVLLTALVERRDRFERAREILTDPARTGFLFVVTPERLPILETTRAVATLRKYGIPVSGVVLNRTASGPAAVETGDGETERANRLAEIAAAFDGLPRWHLPQARRDAVGLEALRELGRSLTVVADS